MIEAKIRAEVEGRQHHIVGEVNWLTPAGNQRTAPIYVARVTNEYLGRERELKAKSRAELEYKINDCLDKWNEQEIRKRVASAKLDAKERGQAETQGLDQEAKAVLREMDGLLEATLAIDDRIDWEAERDTRTYPPFTYPDPPPAPAPSELELPAAPGWMWLFRGRRARWEKACEESTQFHAEAEATKKARWEAAIAEYNQGLNSAAKEHEELKQKFLSEQDEHNRGLAAFRDRFEAHDVGAIEEYCSRVLERSTYPEALSVAHAVEFDASIGTVVVNLELPPKDEIPDVSGYKFVTRGNRSEPIKLKSKELDLLHKSILDQIVIRTMHEIFESCYTNSVQRVIVNAWVTSLNKATGLDVRKQVRCIGSDREGFEAKDLARIEPAACVELLSEGVGRISGRPQ